jgi:hypothetical protein
MGHLVNGIKRSTTTYQIAAAVMNAHTHRETQSERRSGWCFSPVNTQHWLWLEFAIGLPCRQLTRPQFGKANAVRESATHFAISGPRACQIFTWLGSQCLLALSRFVRSEDSVSGVSSFWCSSGKYRRGRKLARADLRSLFRFGVSLASTRSKNSSNHIRIKVAMTM